MIEYIKLELEKLKFTNKLKKQTVPDLFSPTALTINSKKFLNFTSWDYLNLSFNKSILNQVCTSIQETGFSIPSPRTVYGANHELLSAENRLSKFLLTQSSLFFSSRNQALLSVITNLFNEKDILFIEESIQSPVIDAAYLINCEVYTFSIHDLTAFEREISKPRIGSKAVFIDSIHYFSGTVNDLSLVAKFAELSNALLFVDESLSLAGVGPRGSGVLESTSLKDKVFCIFGGFVYGFSSYGGFIAGDPSLTSYLYNKSRTFILEPSLPTSILTFLNYSIPYVENGALLRKHIYNLSETLSLGLQSLGFSFNSSYGVPILTITFKKMGTAEKFAQILFQKGIVIDYYNHLKYGSSVRIIINAEHMDQHINTLLITLSDNLRLLNSLEKD